MGKYLGVARYAEMNFSIDYGMGPLGWLLIIVMIGAGVIIGIFFLSAANIARREVIEEERDEGHDPPVA